MAKTCHACGWYLGYGRKVEHDCPEYRKEPLLGQDLIVVDFPRNTADGLARYRRHVERMR